MKGGFTDSLPIGGVDPPIEDDESGRRYEMM